MIESNYFLNQLICKTRITKQTETTLLTSRDLKTLLNAQLILN